MPIVAGIDGCPTGWLCLTRDQATGAIEARILAHIRELLELRPRPAVVLIDVPIGLPEAGPRRCDQEARFRLTTARARSVFPAPIRPMLAAASYVQACQIGATIDGRKLSRQTWNIVPKIREVDVFLRGDCQRPNWLREVHPEVSFWAWNGQQPMTHSKKSAAGRSERAALVERQYGAAYSATQTSLPRRCYHPDDLLDAFAALWTAERVVAGTALVLPSQPPHDAEGLPMQIVA
jgi:predicted RNase H-like nuclease